MPTQKLKSKTRIGSKEIKVYDEPKSPFHRLIESAKTPQKTKDLLLQKITLYNPVELQHNVNGAIIRLRQRLAQSNRKISSEDKIASVTFLNEASRGMPRKSILLKNFSRRHGEHRGRLKF